MQIKSKNQKNHNRNNRHTPCCCHRFNPLDKRCGINLDEIDPAQWKLLEAATDDYIAASKDRFKQLSNILVAPASTGM